MCIASFIIAVPPCLCISIMKCSDKQADLIYALNILRTFDLSWSFPVFEKRLSKMPASAFPLKKSMIKLMPFLLFFCVGSFWLSSLSFSSSVAVFGTSLVYRCMLSIDFFFWKSDLSITCQGPWFSHLGKGTKSKYFWNAFF